MDYEHQDQGRAYAIVRELLGRFCYEALGKRDKGVVRSFLAKTTGFSEVQIDRLIRQWRETGRIEDRRGGNRGRPFEHRYTAADIRLLAEVDEAFGQMSGVATCELLRGQHVVFGEVRFERLAGLSHSHVYNLRASRTYVEKANPFNKAAIARMADVSYRQVVERAFLGTGTSQANTYHDCELSSLRQCRSPAGRWPKRRTFYVTRSKFSNFRTVQRFMYLNEGAESNPK